MNAKTPDECAACAHHVGGECRATSGGPEYGECGHYEGCTGFAQRRDETVREVCEEISEATMQVYAFSASQIYEWRDRILAAHERELAAKDDVHLQWRKNYHDQLAAKDAEIAQLVTKCNRLMAALKPVMECNLNMGEDYFDLFYAVREAQRVMKEGGV